MIKAEYIWIDGTEPTPQLRSKTKILNEIEKPPVWGFDGSSTNQAEGHNSDCVLNPVFVCADPIRGWEHKLVLCEVLNTDMTPHISNERAALQETYERFKHHDAWFGMEQEYTFVNVKWNSQPYGFIKSFLNDKHEPLPQGPYYFSCFFKFKVLEASGVEPESKKPSYYRHSQE